MLASFKKMFGMISVQDRIHREMLVLNQNIYLTEQIIHRQQATLKHDTSRLAFLQTKLYGFERNAPTKPRVPLPSIEHESARTE